MQTTQFPPHGDLETVRPSANAATPLSAQPPTAKAVRSLPWYAWLLILSFAFAVYSNSFAGFQAIERQHDVIADSDAANFALLLKNFGLGRKMGDEYNTVQRSAGDIAQKHKIHHVLYAAVGSALLTILTPIYQLFGSNADRALYGVNALIVCLNLVLLYHLLRRFNPHANAPWPFLLFYGAALSTWIYGSIPESWPFSATLVLLFFLLLGRGSHRRQGFMLGVIMLNNIFLASLWVILAFDLKRSSPSAAAWLRRSFVAGVIAVATWAGSLAALSVFDGSFRPDHFVQYTIWFRDYASGGDLPLTDPYVFQTASTNLLINSVVSNQPDPKIPNETLLTTLQESRLGLVAVALYLLISAVAFFALLRGVIKSSKEKGIVEALTEDRGLYPAFYCAIMLVATVVLFFSSGFLYSTVLLPMIALFLCRNLDLSRRPHVALLYGTLAVMVINNAIQVMKFRDVLITL